MQWPMSKRSNRLRKLISPMIGRARSFGRDEDGVTAVEFAFLALPFFTIVTAILETSLIFLAGQVLDSAVQDSARLIRTGRAQTNSPTAFSQADFRAAICAGLYGMFDCDVTGDKLRISVTVLPDFPAATLTYPLEPSEDCEEDQCDWTLVDLYNPGDGDEVVLVQAYYKWPTIVRLPGFNFQTMPDGSRLIGASRVFRNEPFS